MTVRVTKNDIALFVMHNFGQSWSILVNLGQSWSILVNLGYNAKVVSVHMTNAPLLFNAVFVQI